MPNDKIRNPRGPSLASRLNHQSRTRTAGYQKTNKDEVRLFKQRLKDGMSPEAARKGTKISERMVGDILAGRTWASVIVLVILAFMLMGNTGCPTPNDNQRSNARAYCWNVDPPLCSEVSITYPCLCLYGPSAVTSEQDERELYRSAPTPGYEYEGGHEEN